MKRRDTFMALAAAAAAPAALARAASSPELSDQDVESLLRNLVGVEPRPGEAARVRRALLENRAGGETDPRVQPAFAFNPEVEV